MEYNLFSFIADDTEYGYHSASSSSAEHHAAQLGPSVQQQQQQNYLQGQNQSQVSKNWNSNLGNVGEIDVGQYYFFNIAT